MISKKLKVILGLSGGVDSSVVAYLLKQQGVDVEAVFMKNWNKDDADGVCPAAEDFEDAQSVAAELRIPFHPVNFSKQYWDKVFINFLSEYKAGRTPNPDILCNKEIKFAVFLDYALSLNKENVCDKQIKIATGHYARIKEKDGEYFLLKGKDNSKDQSYFLYTLGQKQLSQALFPLGELHKTEVRKIAEENDLAVYDKKDSTGICFIGERDFTEFLSRFLKSEPGEMISADGEVLGQHIGLIHYTLGQRKGLGIGGRNSKNASGEPWFVAEKDLKNNQLVVVQGKQHPLLYNQGLTANQLHWVSGKAPTLPLLCQAKTRYRQADQHCEITHIDEQGYYHVRFIKKQFAITPGQSVVFYQQDICLGGGIINEKFA